MKKVLLVGLIVTLLMLTGCVGTNYQTIDASVQLYECAERGLTMPCERLSQYVSPEGKCWNSELGNKICKPGWKEITYAEDLPKCAFIGPTTKVYICDEHGCELKVR